MTIEALLDLPAEPTDEELETHLRQFFPFSRPADLGNLILDKALTVTDAAEEGSMADRLAKMIAAADAAKTSKKLLKPKSNAS